MRTGEGGGAHIYNIIIYLDEAGFSEIECEDEDLDFFFFFFGFVSDFGLGNCGGNGLSNERWLP